MAEPAEVDFRDPDHDPRIVPTNTITYFRTIQGFFKELLDYPQKYNNSDPQQSIFRVLNHFGESSTLHRLYDSEHHLNTNEVSIKIYTYHSCVYSALNTTLRSDDKNTLLLFAPYIYSLLQGLQEPKRHYYGIVYRRIGLSSTSLAAYKKGLLFYWPGFTSCSKDFEIGTKWLGCNAVFVINIPRRFSHTCSIIDDISHYPSEKEVLLQPYTCFRVINDPTQCSGKNITKIELIIESTACSLFGVWTCDDNDHNEQDVGTYFISQYGQMVFWFGRQNKANWNFANVGYGTINDDNELKIEWGDLPVAHDKYSGNLKLKYHQIIKV